MIEKTPIINCNFPNESSLYLSYMPFVAGGGLFIRTQDFYPLEEEVVLAITLLNEQEPSFVAAKVVWYTPVGAQGNRPSGIGVQFRGENSDRIRKKIEAFLEEMLQSTQLTDTI